jgi:thermitase
MGKGGMHLKKRWLTAIGTAVLTVAVVVSSVSGAQSKPPASIQQAHAPGEIIVKFKPGIVDKVVNALHNTIGSELLSRNTKLGFDVVRVDEKLLPEVLKEYRDNPLVEFAEPNYYVHAYWTPDDSNYTEQWSLPQIDAPKAWDVTRSSKDVSIAIVDTGVDYQHPDLDDKVEKGYDYIEDDWDPMDQNGHGTHCAGVAAAETNNHAGVAGMAPNASIYAVRVLDQNGSGKLSDVAEGIMQAADHGSQVISLSLGASSGSSTLKNAVNYAWDKGSVVVAAAGNNGSSDPSYPAYYEKAIAVGATDENNDKASFSNYGSWVDIAAPGTDITSTYLNGKYKSESGTSMAAPHVAGVAALLAAQGRDNDEIRKAIESTSDTTVAGTGVYWSHGLLNAEDAVRY